MKNIIIESNNESMSMLVAAALKKLVGKHIKILNEFTESVLAKQKPSPFELNLIREKIDDILALRPGHTVVIRSTGEPVEIRVVSDLEYSTMVYSDTMDKAIHSIETCNVIVGNVMTRSLAGSN